MFINIILELLFIAVRYRDVVLSKTILPFSMFIFCFCTMKDR